MGIEYGILGLLMGSAGNALIDRLPRNESWFKGRSHCDKCGHVLNFRDLIPVFSYISLGGKCRYCGAAIPFRNVLVEVFLGLSFVVILSHSLSFGSLLVCLILWVTTIIAVMDWETKLVSEAMVLVWIVLVVLMQFGSPLLLVNSKIKAQNPNQIQNFQIQNNFLGLALGLLVIGGLWAGTKGRAMGFGDVEIAAVGGWWLGWPKIGVGLWVAFVAGAVVGLVKLIRHQAKLKSEIPFGPFLILGFWVAWGWGEMLIKFLISNY